MNVVWATHRSWDPTGPYLGGAERCDQLMLARAPVGVDITTLAPGFSDTPNGRMDLEAADRVIVSGLKFSPDEMRMLAASHPLIWSHDMEFANHPIHDFASDLVCMTPWHQDRHEALLRLAREDGPRLHICPGWFDTSPWEGQDWSVDRGETGLWAHRPAWHKNLPGASAWADEHGVKLRVIVNRPREEVIGAMKESRYFILLSLIPDPGPWAVIESQLAGCTPIVNDLVGVFDMEPAELRDLIDGGDQRFWSIVLDY